MNDSLDFGVRISLILDDIELGDFDIIPWHLHQLNYHPGSVIPNLSTLFNQHKTEILKEILMVIKDPEILGIEQEDLEGIIDSLKLLGIRWPEIAIIEKSLNIPSKPLDESTVPQYYIDPFLTFNKDAYFNFQHGWRNTQDLVNHTDTVVNWIDKLWKTDRAGNNNARYAVERLVNSDDNTHWTSSLRPVMDNHKTDIMQYLLRRVKAGATYYAARDMQLFLKLGVDWPEMLSLKDWLYRNGNNNVKQKLTDLNESDRYHVANIKKYISSWPAIDAVCEIANRLNYGQVELEEIKPVVEQHKTPLITGILKAIREGDTGDALYAANILTSLLGVDWLDLKVIQNSLIKDVYS